MSKTKNSIEELEDVKYEILSKVNEAFDSGDEYAQVEARSLILGHFRETIPTLFKKYAEKIDTQAREEAVEEFKRTSFVYIEGKKLLDKTATENIDRHRKKDLKKEEESKT